MELKTIEEKIEDYIKENSMNRMYMTDYVKAGYDIAKKELEEQLKESREVIEALAECKYPVDPNSDCDMLIDEAKAYLEKWK